MVPPLAGPPLGPPNPRINLQQAGPQIVPIPRPDDTGIVALLYGRIGAQTGWMLIGSLIFGMFILSNILTRDVFCNPRNFISYMKGDFSKSETILWVGWLFIAFFVFGVANATFTYAYYLVGLGVPR